MYRSSRQRPTTDQTRAALDKAKATRDALVAELRAHAAAGGTRTEAADKLTTLALIEDEIAHYQDTLLCTSDHGAI